MTEHQEQVALISWFRLQYPGLVIFAIPNGGVRTIGTAKKLKAEGVLAGVSDLFLMFPCKAYHGMFIEMKTKIGKVSASQKAFQSIAKKMGYNAIVCYSFEEAAAKIKEYLDF